MDVRWIGLLFGIEIATLGIGVMLEFQAFN
jgi:hypothetical protein